MNKKEKNISDKELDRDLANLNLTEPDLFPVAIDDLSFYSQESKDRLKKMLGIESKPKNTKRRKILEVGGEGGSIVYEEIILDGKTFYTQKISETHFADNEKHTESTSPLYYTFKEAMENSKIDIFMLSPSYVDPEIWNELSEMFTDYCDTKEIEMFTKEEWTKALGIHDLTAVYDDIESLGLSKGDAFQLCEIMCKVQMHEKREEELESILGDPFLHEGGGPGTRELFLMLAKQVQG